MAPITPTVIRRPMLLIQSDWDEVLREKEGTAWVSCKDYGSTSKHGKLSVADSGDNNIYSLQASDNFKVEKVTQKSLIILHEDPNCKCEFFAPTQIFRNIHKKSVCSIGVSGSGLGVSVCGENKLCIWDTNSGTILRNLEGHIWDVYSCRFFPSGVVVLSAGADMQLKIWSAETGECPATLMGHTAAIVSTAIVDRGRNIVSVSKDGTARLWDCGKSACIDIISKENGTINCGEVEPVDIDVGQPEIPPSEREVGTDGKLLLFGTECGTLKGVGLQSRKQIFEYKCDSAINCCCFTSPTIVAFGTQSGKIYLFDLRARLPVTIWEESASPVLSIISKKNGLFYSRADGTCSFMALDKELCLQLTGPSFDPVLCMAYDGTAIYTGCRDGLIRKYNLSV